jgi:hypothetical protein
MKKYWIMILLLPLVQWSFAQEVNDRVMEQVEAQKVAFFTQKMNLSVEESQAFWPIYNEYQEKTKALRDNYRTDFVKGNMNDAEAAEAIEGYFDKEEKALLLKKQLYQDLGAHIAPGKLVKLQLVENQFKQKLLERIKKRRESRRKP